MPTTYDRTLGSYRVTCSRCGVYCTSNSPYDPAAVTTAGSLVGDVFRWQSNNGAFVSRCRACERAVRQARGRTTRSARVPGTTGAWPTPTSGATRRYGVELELIFPSGVDRYDIQNALNAVVSRWSVKSDGSLSGRGAGYGWEIVSPVLSGEDGFDQIRKVCQVVASLGGKPNRTCGLHAHHEIRELTVDQIKAVTEAWCENQDVIDGFVAPSRRQHGSSGYCQRLSQSERTRIHRARDLSSIQNLLSHDPYSARYRAFNLGSYGRYGTVEIRQHQGTADAEKIITWVRFVQALIETAAATADSPATRRHSRVTELFTTLGDRLNETARTFLLGRAVTFGHATI
jgi:putative amidoligase enzyme